jgi:hypothetical protein
VAEWLVAEWLVAEWLGVEWLVAEWLGVEWLAAEGLAAEGLAAEPWAGSLARGPGASWGLILELLPQVGGWVLASLRSGIARSPLGTSTPPQPAVRSLESLALGWLVAQAIGADVNGICPD